MKRIAVLGAGLMGHGIAQIFLAAGHRVALQDPDPNTLASAPGRIRSIFDLLELDAAGLDCLELTGGLEGAVGDADLVIEAAPEKLELKRRIFSDLVSMTGDRTILASNTSGLPISEIARELGDAGRVIGTHFWNPPHLVPLVEVIQGDRTDPAIVEPTIELLRSVGKTAVHVKKDVPGFYRQPPPARHSNGKPSPWWKTESVMRRPSIWWSRKDSACGSPLWARWKTPISSDST